MRMTVCELLNLAKEYLVTRGWKKFDAGLHGGPRCILGAIFSAARPTLGESQRQLLLEAAYHTINAALGKNIEQDDEFVPMSNITAWNDSAPTTFEAVIMTLDRAIAIATAATVSR